MVGRVSYLGRVKQGNFHIHVLYTIPNPNYTLPKPYPFIITWESVTLCKYQHYPTLDTYLSISFHSDTLPEYLPYPINSRKTTPPYIEYLPNLPHPRHLSLHTCTHLTLPSITYPNLHFPTLYYCQGLIKYMAETTYQIRSKRPRTEPLRPKRPKPKRQRVEMTQGWNERPENAVAVVEQVRTCRVVHLIISQYCSGANILDF